MRRKKKELIVHPRSAVSIYPDSDGMPDYGATPIELAHRKLTIHLPKSGAPVSCISFETTKFGHGLDKMVIPTSAFVDGGFSLVYAYYGGTLNHALHSVRSEASERVTLASFNQTTHSLFYAIFASSADFHESIEIPPHFDKATVRFDKFSISVAHMVIPIPTILNGLSFFNPRCPQSFFTENEFVKPPAPLNLMTSNEVAIFCAFQLLAMSKIVVDGIAFPSDRQRAVARNVG